MASYDELYLLDDIDDIIDDVYDEGYADIRKATDELSGYDVYRQWIEPDDIEKVLSAAQLRQRVNAAKARARKLGVAAGAAAAVGAGVYGARRMRGRGASSERAESGRKMPESGKRPTPRGRPQMRDLMYRYAYDEKGRRLHPKKGRNKPVRPGDGYTKRNF